MFSPLKSFVAAQASGVALFSGVVIALSVVTDGLSLVSHLKGFVIAIFLFLLGSWLGYGVYCVFKKIFRI